jgi:diguanylate cyclase (GGDEF)-like protein
MKVSTQSAVIRALPKAASRTRLMMEAVKPLVLVIDDDPIDRALVAESLAARGFRIIEAADGGEGLRKIAAARPDLVLLDVMLPDLDGFAVCAALRAEPSGHCLPVLMMTALDDVTSMQRAFHAGATDFVTKPFDPSLLEFRLRFLLRAKAMGDDLRQREALLASAQRIAQLGHFVHAPGRGFSLWSTQTHAVLGLDEQVWITTLDDLLQHVEPADRARVADALALDGERARDEAVEFRIRVGSGDTRTILLHTEREAHEDGWRVVGTVQNISERRRAEQRIHRLAWYDLVTGLPNRLMLERRLRDYLARAERRGEGVAVVAIDLDRFQRVNHSIGRDAGNGLLDAVGRRLAGSVRASGGRAGPDGQAPRPADFVARSGSDEFCLALPGIAADSDVECVVRRVREALQQPFNLAEQEIVVTSSIGVALYPGDGKSPELLLRHAEVACTHARRRGGDRCEFYAPHLDARAHARLTTETNLRHALGSEQLSLHYQPKVRVATGEVTGMEALVRWEHPTLGRVAPAEFIPIAEESGLILPLGEWIFTEACRQLAEWRRAGLVNLRCAVNLSAAQFRDRRLPERIADALDAARLPPGALQLELTESLVMEDADAARAMLGRLRELGISIAVDDFGTGYSSLHYLKRLPLDVLKIDQTFVRELGTDAGDGAIVEAVIAMARGLRLGVVAEGVELEPQLECLRTLGCEEAQGYLFSKPLPPAQFVEWLRRRTQPHPLAAGGA